MQEGDPMSMNDYEIKGRLEAARVAANELNGCTKELCGRGRDAWPQERRTRPIRADNITNPITAQIAANSTNSRTRRTDGTALMSDNDPLGPESLQRLANRAAALEAGPAAVRLAADELSKELAAAELRGERFQWGFPAWLREFADKLERGPRVR